MIQKKLKILFFLIVMAVFFSCSAFCADYTYININNPFIRQIPLAVPDFKKITDHGNEADHGRKARDLIANALAFTGYINIMARGAFLESPARTGISKAEINFKNWTSIGAELLITGGIVEQKNSVRLKLRLFDTFKEKLLVGKVYTGHKSDLRKMVHRFCGEVSYLLTGKRGIFSSKIVFVSTVKGNKELFTCDFDGYGVKQETHLKSITLSPSWSSNGEWLAYTSYVNGNPDIYIKNLKQKQGYTVALKGMNITPDWVPGQLALAACLSFSGDQEIYLLTGKGKIIKRITRNWGIDISPEFSPDGKKMAFVSKRSGTPQIYIKDLADGRVQRLTFEGRYNTSPSWSPDGDRLAFVAVAGGQIDIYVIATNGKGLVQLTKDAGDNEDPAWSPDGSLVTFTSTREGVPRIYVMTAAGGQQRRLLKLEGAQTDPEWSRENVNN
ncbi:MAG: Tol-Pal system beta propeller repeat protein TolB [Thermodesulfobacteriota bacterium]|nr:Tol-Pal system beta propeller repeat protein TolB [Thermodesulfobacteriota bacterium]